jgi:hypothetical protein
LYSFNVTSSLPAAATSGLPSSGGSSGIIINSDPSAAGALQIYFSTLADQACSGGFGGCAAQASQSAVK